MYSPLVLVLKCEILFADWRLDCCIIAMALSFSYTGLTMTRKLDDSPASNMTSHNLFLPETKHFRHSWDQPLSIFDEAYLKVCA